jgi:plastocyanin
MLDLKTIAVAAGLSLALALPAFAADHAVAIQGMKFVPAAITVAPGDTITFTNMDAAPHTATANDGSFDTGRLGKGESAQVTIGAAGTFDYICKIHPAMKGRVVAK